MELRIYSVTIELVRELRGTAVQIERKDRDLGNQLRRAASSVVLNLSEGMYSRAGLRPARYHTALGSAREVAACLEVAAAWGYIPPVHDTIAGKLRQVIGTLVRLT
jgi:four helix bundle protein